MKQYDLLIVGGGIAGLKAAQAARELDSGLSIALLSEERLPYKRTKLSKNLVRGFERDSFALENREWYRQNSIDLYTDLEVSSLDPEKMTIESSPLGSFQARCLVLATGSMPTVPEQYRDKHAHVLYRARDAEQLLDIPAGRPVHILGSGVLGVEVADQFLQKGSQVSISGRRDRFLHRALTPRASSILAGLIQKQGVTVSLGKSDPPPSDSELILCCGVEPRIQLARSSGLDCGRGIKTDSYLRTSRPFILSAGDCVEMPDGYYSHLWHAAENMGRAAGANAALLLQGHEPVPYQPLPWRMKMEAFGQYFFSIGYEGLDLQGLEIEEQEESGVFYRWIARRQGRPVSIASVGEAGLAKQYQQEVQAGVKA